MNAISGQQTLPGIGMGYESISSLKLSHERFCWEYVVNGGNGKAAYLVAYPQATPRTAVVNSAKLLTIAAIMDRVDELKAELRRRYTVTADELIAYHSRVLKIDRREFLDKNGEVKPLETLSGDAAGILEFEQQRGHKGGVVTLLKLPTRHSSAVELAKILGLGKDAGSDDADSVRITDIEAAAKLHQMFTEWAAHASVQDAEEGVDAATGTAEDGL